jgi:hypothetical protein
MGEAKVLSTKAVLKALCVERRMSTLGRELEIRYCVVATSSCGEGIVTFVDIIQRTQ